MAKEMLIQTNMDIERTRTRTYLDFLDWLTNRFENMWNLIETFRNNCRYDDDEEYTEFKHFKHELIMYVNGNTTIVPAPSREGCLHLYAFRETLTTGNCSYEDYREANSNHKFHELENYLFLIKKLYHDDWELTMVADLANWLRKLDLFVEDFFLWVNPSDKNIDDLRDVLCAGVYAMELYKSEHPNL